MNTENIDNFINNKPGIRFTSKVNSECSFEATIVQKEIGVCYIKNINNEYLALKIKQILYMMLNLLKIYLKMKSCLWGI